MTNFIRVQRSWQAVFHALHDRAFPLWETEQAQLIRQPHEFVPQCPDRDDVERLGLGCAPDAVLDAYAELATLQEKERATAVDVGVAEACASEVQAWLAELQSAN